MSLSHYCPTVARMAFDADARLDIVQAPASLVGHVALEGLDAREALPPLLRPGLLMDRTGYQAWERVVIDILATPRAPEAALAKISAFTERVRTWTPRDGDLREAVERGRTEGRQSARPGSVAGRTMGKARRSWPMTTKSFAPRCRRASPPCRRPIGSTRSTPGGWPWPGRSSRKPLRNFLAAHAFGNWCAYHGLGLRTVVRSLEVALSVVRVEAARLCEAADRPLDEPLLIEAMRAADLLLVHLADPKSLAARLSDSRGRPRGCPPSPRALSPEPRAYPSRPECRDALSRPKPRAFNTASS